MGKSKRDKVLENWMKEFFPYGEFKRAGVFTKEMRGDYEAQAKKICNRLGLNSIYEYGKDEIRCHISYVKPGCPSGMQSDLTKPFISVTPSIWDE